MTRAVVFAYHNVGVRCLAVLLAHGIEVALVVTHDDAPGENIWFESVASLARLQGVETVTPARPNDPEFVARLSTLRPEFLFSFYYRHMLSPAVLATASHGAFNMHGSLLPKYRGRVPVNWAIVRGERETGATLHEMVEKPDAGRIVDQQAVPILPNDTAREVFGKVTVAAEMVLDRSVPRLVAGTAALRAQNLSQGSYFGGRKPADGRIDSTQDAWSVHNLVRAVAPRRSASRRSSSTRARFGCAAPTGACCACSKPSSRGSRSTPKAFRAGPRPARSLSPDSEPPLESTPHCHEKNPDPRRQRLHRAPPLQAHRRADRLGGVRHGHEHGPDRRSAAGEALPLLRG
jgi:methionyl-tRNA formyltransferase